MWEVPVITIQNGNWYRITPTYVGSTGPIPFLKYLVRDHPHVCGKYVLNSRWSTSFTGSPPRMWEVLVQFVIIKPLPGITPTYVGSTKVLRHFGKTSRDHPHVCGKYLGGLSEKLPLIGSPPRMWEVHIYAAYIYILYRITPTYVGSTNL